MNKDKRSFLLHIDSLDILNDLTDEQAGKLFKAIKSYQMNEEVELDSIVKIAFSPFKTQFVRDNKRYDETCKRRADAGRIGGLAKASNTKQKVAIASDTKQKVANLADSSNKSKSNNKSVSNTEVIKTRGANFVAPLIQEVTEYFDSQAISKNIIINRNEPEKFIDFYASNGWKVGKNKMKDWKASIRNWMKNVKPEKQNIIEQSEQSNWHTEDLGL